MQKILIVDDLTYMRDLMAQAVTVSMGMPAENIYIAGNGDEALKIAERRQFNVAIIDKGMPGMDGYELAKKLVKFFPNIKIGIVSGDGCKEEALAKEEVKAFLAKPFKMEDFKQFFHHLLSA